MQISQYFSLLFATAAYVLCLFVCEIKPDKTHRKSNFIPNYELKINSVCNTHNNSFNFYRDLFWVTFLNMEKTTFLSLVSYRLQILES